MTVNMIGGSDASEQGLLAGAKRHFMRSFMLAAALLAVSVALPVGAKPLHVFSGGDGEGPQGVLADSHGNLYGVTSNGGANGTDCSGYPCGTVFELVKPPPLTAIWNLITLYSFAGGTDGQYPLTGLTRASKTGNLYGVTYVGGSCNVGSCGPGTVFELVPPIGGSAWTESVIWRFGQNGGPDGANPATPLLLSGTTLYGMAQGGGTLGSGTVFKLPIGGSDSLLHSFAGPPVDGSFPALTALVAAPRGNFYGMTVYGGTGTCVDASNGRTGCGTVFSLPQKGGNDTILYSFQGAGASDGSYPVGRVVVRSGILFGITETGGTGSCVHGCGTAFMLRPPTVVGGSWSETVIWDFAGGVDGQQPVGGLVADGKGNLYGSTEQGGNGNGTLFELSPPSTPGNPWTKKTYALAGDGTEGVLPYGDIVLKDGMIYGSAAQGGSSGCGGSGCGTVFAVAASALQ